MHTCLLQRGHSTEPGLLLQMGAMLSTAVAAVTVMAVLI